MKKERNAQIKFTNGNWMSTERERERERLRERG